MFEGYSEYYAPTEELIQEREEQLRKVGEQLEESASLQQLLEFDLICSLAHTAFEQARVHNKHMQN